MTDDSQCASGTQQPLARIYDDTDDALVAEVYTVEARDVLAREWWARVEEVPPRD